MRIKEVDTNHLDKTRRQEWAYVEDTCITHKQTVPINLDGPTPWSNTYGEAPCSSTQRSQIRRRMVFRAVPSYTTEYFSIAIQLPLSLFSLCIHLLLSRAGLEPPGTPTAAMELINNYKIHTPHKTRVAMTRTQVINK